MYPLFASGVMIHLEQPDASQFNKHSLQISNYYHTNTYDQQLAFIHQHAYDRQPICIRCYDHSVFLEARS